MNRFKDNPYKLIDLQKLWQINEIDSDFQKKISFQEFLIVGKFYRNQDTPTPLGAICLNVVNAVNDCSKLVVYLRSAFDIDGRKAGSKITSWLDAYLHTIEEKRTEFLEYCKSEECTEPYIKQSLYVSVQQHHIHLHHTQEGCSLIDDDTRTLPFELTQNLIGEGANFALMRLLAQTKYIGQFEATTLYINGDLCRNLYLCTGPEAGIVNNHKMDVCKIYRKIIEKCGIIHICSTTLTITGRIITHEWNNCDYVVYLNPMVDLSPTYNELEPIENIDCFADLQLYSNYLDRKQLCISRMKNYMQDQPDIQSILADYVQTVLQMKPSDTIKFTMEYFTRFAVHK